MAISITGELRQKITNALADGYPCFVGTASADGKPQISMRGSVAVYDGETLCWWERGMRSSIDNIDENPQAIIFYRNSGERIHWRFHGRVTLYASGAERERAMGLTQKAEPGQGPGADGGGGADAGGEHHGTVGECAAERLGLCVVLGALGEEYRHYQNGDSYDDDA